MESSKADFLKTQFVPLLKQIPSDTLPHWGKMTLQQMTEHFSESVRIASGKLQQELVTLPENIEKMQAFLMSGKPFRENTPNPNMPEIPAPVRHKIIREAFAELEQELAAFFAVFEADFHKTTCNPFFGDLNFEQNVQLLYKHAVHHLRQFGIMIGEPV
ncbi:MAG: hypothetical protein JWP88_1878 [Flaviaesturariibacter sp.]|nr:hypothetical protein [Flaviaesturariibacter sp.]